MSYLNICGFEIGDSSVCAATVGTLTFNWAYPPSGNERNGYGYVDVDGSLGGNHNFILSSYTQNIGVPTTFSADTIYVGAGVQLKAAPSGTVQLMGGRNSTTKIKGNVHVNADRTLSVYTGSTSVAGGSTVLALNTWYYIEFKTQQGAAGAYELRINGVTELSGTANFAVGNYWDVVFGNYSLTLNTYRFWFDDIYINDANFCPGIPSIDLLFANSNGTYTGWLGALGSLKVTKIQDHPPDGDTTFLYSSTNGSVYTMLTTSDFVFAAATDAVPVIKYHHVVRVASGGAPAFRYISRSGTSDDMTDTDDNPGAGYRTRCRLWETDWDTSLPWTVSTATSSETGVYDNSGASCTLRVTHLSGEMLYYTPTVSRAKYTPHAGI